MSFGGSVAAMLRSLENNKRSRTSTYEKIERYNSNYKRPDKLFFAKKATSEQISEIGKKIRRENRKILAQKILIISLLSILIAFAIGFVKF